jgi:uncharacterized alpha-E superfamily protein
VIARVAEQCYWLNRYMERTENTARLLQVNLTFLLDVSLPPDQLWRPVLRAAGEESDFEQHVGAALRDDAEAVQTFMVWDWRNPVSLRHSLHSARENARTIRETISLELWHSVNAFWLWLDGGAGERLYVRERHAFYERVKEFCQLFHGQSHTTMLYDQPFDFMRLGSLLERADQTTRLISALLQRIDPRASNDRSPAAAAAWLAMLRSCSAVESFAKRGLAPMSATTVIGFLLLEPAFPRSVRHCLTRAGHFVERIGAGGPATPSAIDALETLGTPLLRSAPEIVAGGIDVELERLMGGIADVGSAIHRQYFAAPVGSLAGVG